MWTLDPRARQISIEADTLFGFIPMPTMCVFRDWMLFRMFNSTCVSADMSQHNFRQLMSNIDEVEENDIPFDRVFANENDLSDVCERNLMSLVSFVGSEDVDLHAKLRHYIAVLTPAKAGSMGVVKIENFRR